MKIIITENQNKSLHLHRRIGEIKKYFDENEELFVSVAGNTNILGFCHAVSMYISDMVAQDVESTTSNPNFDYVTFRNQVQRFIQSHFYEELRDFHNKHKKQLNESEGERLFNDLPNSLKRRLTTDDFEYFDKELRYYIVSQPPVDKFDDFSSVVVGDLLHDFIMDKKVDEIETEEDPDYGVVYNDESRNKIMGMYWDLKPILIKKYKDRLYKAWERKKIN
jgi:hypothetical protein